VQVRGLELLRRPDGLYFADAFGQRDDSGRHWCVRETETERKREREKEREREGGGREKERGRKRVGEGERDEREQVCSRPPHS